MPALAQQAQPLRRCINCGHTLAQSNKDTTCYRPCKAPVESTAPEHIVSATKMLRAAEDYYGETISEIFVKINTGPLAHKRKVIVYLLQKDCRLANDKVAVLAGRDNNAVVSAFNSAEKKLSFLAEDIIGIRKLYLYTKTG